jgi:DNA-directed RNA polymerase subunit M/transcription elongation factor TFIIS
MCKTDLKAPYPQSLMCKCGHKFKPIKSKMFFKVRCGHCGNIIEQPIKNIGQNAICPVCAESSLIQAPPQYAKYMEEMKARKEEDKERKKAERGRRKAKKTGKRGGRGIRKGMSRKREAVRKATGQGEEEEIKFECAFCGAGISQANVDRQEAEERDGLWYCWDHVPQD